MKKRKSRMIWTKEDIFNILNQLPKNISINKKQLYKYYKDGRIPFWPGLITIRFGLIKNACEEASLKCHAIYTKEELGCEVIRIKDGW